MDAGDISTQEPDPTFRQAATYAVTVIVVAALFLGIGAALYDPVPLVIIIVFPLLVLAGAVGALWWTFRTWQAKGRWQIWQGASWFLLALFLISLGGTGSALLDR
ncbi:hypothetical protein [Williamsia maris]|uniref:Transmembrane protein n=1 Tax=Williamsia maris TaxID=72806 RepID=A0ABT1H8L1_9NOCA|nr:hypothetical protein [Williamsia maris]MCP2174559.1 hypothetical protein [Williamsia maris]